LGDGAAYVGIYGPAGSTGDGNWHYLVHTFNRAAGTGITYLDGVYVSTVSISAIDDVTAATRLILVKILQANITKLPLTMWMISQFGKDESLHQVKPTLRIMLARLIRKVLMSQRQLQLASQQ